MTTGAITSDAHVIKDRWTKRCGRVAKVTILAGRYMNHRRIFAGSKQTVVTTFTPTSNALMIEDRGDKSISRDMTNTAIILCWNMRVCFAGGYDRIMTGRAVVKDVYMIECRSNKRIRVEMTD